MPPLPEPYASHLPPLLAAAFAEDLPDVTGLAVFGAEDATSAVLIAKKPGVLCGAPAFAAAFAFLDPGCRVESSRDDGAAVGAGEVLARVSGAARAILAAERTALNLAARLSGIASLTRRFVDAVAGTGCQVLDTRKTTPGWRALEKHAVRCGGGANHRMGLYDAAMLKDTHLGAAGSLAGAVAKVRQRWGEAIPLVVECATLEQVDEALACKVAHIMLDNMDLAAMRDAVARVAGRARLEASGGVTLDTVRAVAETGVDLVSVGALTHSAPVLDLSLQVRR
ncbi:MAG TPA: carboxylating nicotinate-nucleotide diphosphorylase [Thermoanaerobaculaceae bacterium]|nr:carboxylating nicotinate-nucleotide diphosphorylase [Thermoanaerobaculaceae bacterium]